MQSEYLDIIKPIPPIFGDSENSNQFTSPHSDDANAIENVASELEKLRRAHR